MQFPSDPPLNTLSNPNVPSSLPRLIAIPLSIISTISYIALLPSYLLYQTTIYYTIGPPHASWSLGTLLFTRGLGMLLAFMYRFGLPQPDGGSAWKVPIAARRKGMNVECRKIAGIPEEEEEELRIDWARQKDVRVVDVPGFMIWPEAETTLATTNSNSNVTSANTLHGGKGYARAQPGEKIVYYLVGGGFISGHPLRTHLAWWTSQMLRERERVRWEERGVMTADADQAGRTDGRRTMMPGAFGNSRPRSARQHMRELLSRASQRRVKSMRRDGEAASGGGSLGHRASFVTSLRFEPGRSMTSLGYIIETPLMRDERSECGDDAEEHLRNFRSVNYRKSLSVDTAFPACLLDALAGYLFLTRDLGFEPSNIILMGDSAGGNLALALARYLGELAERGGSERTKNIGQVGGMILYSDYVGGFGHSGVVSHTRHFPSLLSSPYFSPSLPLPNNAPRFTHLVDAGVKVYIQTGNAELLYSEDLDLARDMKREGVDVRLREVEGEIHAAILFRREKAMRASEKDIPEFWNSLGQ
ncbi:hypothetical protein QFC21_007149 [Naganishia friedmannii]|uniref:Uncharacterized protein n=1 Tax=Naganishia friedmannii TaxID=89922 RepID=A0ACC2UXD5_9TREE|nr:hypothetical protein QFC21_007149 [Naganishia friedmannii]